MLRSHRAKGHKFRRQVPIGRYIADFVCHEARLIVEVDGGQHDRSSPQEAERDGFLHNEGYRILRFWNNEVLVNLDGVHQAIVGELRRITPTQTLPHQGPIKGEGFSRLTTLVATATSLKSGRGRAGSCVGRGRDQVVVHGQPSGWAALTMSLVIAMSALHGVGSPETWSSSARRMVDGPADGVGAPDGFCFVAQ